MYTVGRKLAYGQSDAAVEIVKGRPYITLAPQRGSPILLRCWMATYFYPYSDQTWSRDAHILLTWAHCLGMSYYVNFFLGSNEFHIK